MSGFLIDKFSRAKFERRTEIVKIDNETLKEFFEKDQEPVFIIQNLNAAELNISIEAELKNKSIDNVIKALSKNSDQVAGIRKTLGISSDVPSELAKRIEMMVFGCVNPKIDHAVAVKFAENFPMEFYDITNKIANLTGTGGSLVKQQPSSQKNPG
jgi:hypothetical protein